MLTKFWTRQVKCKGLQVDSVEILNARNSRLRSSEHQAYFTSDWLGVVRGLPTVMSQGPGVHLHITAAMSRVKPLEDSKNKTFRGSQVNLELS